MILSFLALLLLRLIQWTFSILLPIWTSILLLFLTILTTIIILIVIFLVMLGFVLFGWRLLLLLYDLLLLLFDLLVFIVLHIHVHLLQHLRTGLGVLRLYDLMGRDLDVIEFIFFVVVSLLPRITLVIFFFVVLEHYFDLLGAHILLLWLHNLLLLNSSPVDLNLLLLNHDFLCMNIINI